MSIYKNIIKRIVNNNVANSLLKKFISVSNDINYLRHIVITEQILNKQEDIVRKLFDGDLIVKSGPFKGLKYPEAKAIKSLLLPKLLGSYEAELHDIFIERVSRESFTEIVNIGSAEGFYSVGLALLTKDISVKVFDIDEEALIKTKKLAEYNGVADRLILDGGCDAMKLSNMVLSKRPFVLCDCDGCERFIFSKESAKNLKNAELLIELHGHHHVRNSTSVLAIFANSHHISLIQNQKKDPANFPILSELNDEDAQLAICERRAGFTEWAHLIPK